MGKKSRYRKYAEGITKLKKRPSSKSVLQRLKELKNQEFVMTVPFGDADGK